MRGGGGGCHITCNSARDKTARIKIKQTKVNDDNDYNCHDDDRMDNNDNVVFFRLEMKTRTTTV